MARGTAQRARLVAQPRVPSLPGYAAAQEGMERGEGSDRAPTSATQTASRKRASEPAGFRLEGAEGRGNRGRAGPTSRRRIRSVSAHRVRARTVTPSGAQK